MKEFYDIPSSEGNKDYSVILVFDESGCLSQMSNCDCKHGSFYRYTEKNIKAGNWKCKHIIEALVKHEKGGYNVQEEKIKLKSIEPIF